MNSSSSSSFGRRPTVSSGPRHAGGEAESVPGRLTEVLGRPLGKRLRREDRHLVSPGPVSGKLSRHRVVRGGQDYDGCEGIADKREGAPENGGCFPTQLRGVFHDDSRHGPGVAQSSQHGREVQCVGRLQVVGPQTVIASASGTLFHNAEQGHFLRVDRTFRLREVFRGKIEGILPDGTQQRDVGIFLVVVADHRRPPNTPRTILERRDRGVDVLRDRIEDVPEHEQASRAFIPVDPRLEDIEHGFGGLRNDGKVPSRPERLAAGFAALYHANLGPDGFGADKGCKDGRGTGGKPHRLVYRHLENEVSERGPDIRIALAFCKIDDQRIPRHILGAFPENLERLKRRIEYRCVALLFENRKPVEEVPRFPPSGDCSVTVGLVLETRDQPAHELGLQLVELLVTPYLEKQIVHCQSL